MSDLDTLVKEKFVLLRKKIIENFSQKHPHMFSMVSTVFSGKHNKAGLQITENGQVVGKYTIHVEGIHTTNVESDVLDPGVSHPLLGTVKPLFTIEREALERMVNDEEGFTEDFIKTIKKYLPEIKVSFMR